MVLIFGLKMLWRERLAQFLPDFNLFFPKDFLGNQSDFLFADTVERQKVSDKISPASK
jgi:hypothetical protein